MHEHFAIVHDSIFVFVIVTDEMESTAISPVVISVDVVLSDDKFMPSIEHIADSPLTITNGWADSVTLAAETNPLIANFPPLAPKTQ